MLVCHADDVPHGMHVHTYSSICRDIIASIVWVLNARDHLIFILMFNPRKNYEIINTTILILYIDVEAQRASPGMEAEV